MGEVFAKKPEGPRDPWDVAIIGSGPAGLTAAIYTTRGATSTVVLGGEKWGGQLMLTSVVDNYPGFPKGIMGPELMEKMKAQAVRFGAEFRAENVTKIEKKDSIFILHTSDFKLMTRSVILATGAETRWLGVPGEKELIGKGVSSCAPCDAPFFKDKKVLVVGGGDSAMEEALVLSKYTTKVTIIHRRNEFKASAVMQQKVKNNSKISFIWNTEVTKVGGVKKVEEVEVKNTKTGKISEIKTDGVFIAIGHVPSSELVKGMLDLDKKGFVKLDNGPKTKVEGLFVSGDVHDYRYKQAVTAAGYGCQAAMDALSYLDKLKERLQN